MPSMFEKGEGCREVDACGYPSPFLNALRAFNSPSPTRGEGRKNYATAWRQGATIS
jgi:hypothetical protein